ncbi:hypothetical protein FHG87_012216 [Trinorchestia longiramus]|nr:hypothetical protein FHG87_012216 [Trinorchestia longiramus]
MAGGKSKKAGSCNMIECMTCKMWMDLESCKGLTEMSESERNKLVFDCWKCMLDGKSKKAGSCSMIECMTCKMWVDLESCKGLTEMSESERNKLVFDCWKCMLDGKVKMADINMKMEEEIKRLKAEVVSFGRELEDERKLKGGEDAKSKRKVDVM